MRQISFLLLLFGWVALGAQDAISTWQGKFEQLGEALPTPNSVRTADGSPGPDYWQQQADYTIEVKLDEEQRRIQGSQRVIYYNNSPHTLEYLWLQLDQNRRAPHSEEALTQAFSLPDSIPVKSLIYYLKAWSRDGGIHIEDVIDGNGRPLSHLVQKTMLRIDMPEPLPPGGKHTFHIDWWYLINDRMEDAGRSGLEYFPEDQNYVFTIAQFYPRMAVYDDYEGWQHKQFLGAGEFALTFGDYDVKITVPDDHILVATGELRNPKEVLNKKQLASWRRAKTSFEEKIVIASQEDAEVREKQRSKKMKTWHFSAKKVRDFAFATSRKFIWDAQAVEVGGRNILAQSFYPKEGNPLWEEESTKAVINTLRTYSKYSFDYPYPVATSVHAANIGMEYPMICFNFGRPAKDGYYSQALRYNMIGVVIHEVGHNFFPMIVNSDERQWTWMDEGINSFLQYRTEQECYEHFPSSRGPATSIISYMKFDKNRIRPIMTNSEQVRFLGHNAYGKPAAALNILRETVLGQEVFDHALKSYAKRWAFKHPKPADFFRTMEDASGVDLDWFWKGWFYSTDHVDMSIDTVIWFREVSSNLLTEVFNNQRPANFTIIDTPDPYYWEFRDRLPEDAIRKEFGEKYIYEIRFSNKGGLVMPLLLTFEFESGEQEHVQIPAEVWRKNEQRVSKVFYFAKPLRSVVLDIDKKTADVNELNNYFPRREILSKFDKFKGLKTTGK